MGSLSITDVTTGCVEVLGGHMVNGDLLSDMAYVLAQFPTTDDELLPRPMGLPPYVPQRNIPLSCCICGGWAGIGATSGTATDEEYAIAVAAYATTPHFCITHHGDWKFGRFPQYPYPHPRTK